MGQILVTLWLTFNKITINQIEVTGQFRYTTPSILVAAIEPWVVARNWWTVDIVHLSDILQSLPWIRHAYVLRRWPKTLLIVLQEAVPLAIWNDQAIIDSTGQVLYPDALPEHLPVLYGPEEERAEIFKAYQQAKAMLKAVDLDIKRWHGGAQQPWRMILTNDLEVVFGRYDKQARLQRFVALYDVIIGSRSQHARRVDLRYNHGLAVDWQR